MIIPYASNTGSSTNLNQLRRFGWRVLLTPTKPNPRPGLRHGIDNGAWSYYQQGLPFNEEAFAGLVKHAGHSADFVVAPDIVAGGSRSLDLTVSWLPRLSHLRLVLIAVQDGMDTYSVRSVLRNWPNTGIFLGGSTAYKLANMYGWGEVARSFDRWYHVARVNSARRIRLCVEAGAHSFDGTSASMYSCTVPQLDAATMQPSLLTPGRLECL